MTSPVSVVDVEAVTSLGPSWDKTRSQLLKGAVGTDRETIHGDRTQTGRAPVDDGSAPRIPRFHRLARIALTQLIERWDQVPDLPLGLVTATSKGGMGDVDVRHVMNLHNPGIWAGKLAEVFPQKTRVASPNTACATGLSALIQAARWIHHGEVPHALVVASESCFQPLLTAGYQNIGALCDEGGMRPFHPERSGFALAEGAAVMYLWGDKLAERHPEQIIGQITGWGETSDAHHITRMAPDNRGLNHAIDRALDRASLERTAVDLIHAHLTTTEENDRAEHELISNWAGDVLLQGVKPALGHTIGAAGLIEAIAILDVLREGDEFPLPTMRPEDQPDTGAPVKPPFHNGLTWNMGFGGHNAAVVVESDLHTNKSS